MTPSGESVSPAAIVELRRLIDHVEACGLRGTADAMRVQLDREPTADERPCVIQEERGGEVRAIPWGLGEILWGVYAGHGHGDQSLDRMVERGGFGRRELGMLAVGAYGGQGAQIRPRYAKRFPLLDLYDLARGRDVA